MISVVMIVLAFRHNLNVDIRQNSIGGLDRNVNSKFSFYSIPEFQRCSVNRNLDFGGTVYRLIVGFFRFERTNSGSSSYQVIVFGC